MLTNKEYLKKLEPCCPQCKGPNLEWGSIDFEGHEIFQNVCCYDCGFEWEDVYKLKGWRKTSEIR